MNRLINFFLGLLMISLSSCKPQQQTVGKENITQGVSGIVLWREGNFMPSMDGSNKNKSIGISREILLYEQTNLNQAKREGDFFTEVNSKLVKVVTSNPDGTFKVDLPPGTYSVFAKEEGGLFANIFDGQNNIFPVTVEPGKVEKITVIVDYKAAY